jgi:DNA-binding transcriptional MerR regulator
MATAAQAPSSIPEKSLFRIGEVSRLTATKTFVLRYWETEFPTLQPAKSPSGHRLYRREDIETVFEIKRLLYEEGFTIAGARKHLASVDLERGTSPASREVKIFYITQATAAPPTFVLFTNQTKPLHFSYQRFLENRLRASFDFTGTPIRFNQRLKKREPRRHVQERSDRRNR